MLDFMPFSGQFSWGVLNTSFFRIVETEIFCVGSLPTYTFLPQTTPNLKHIINEDFLYTAVTFKL